jgi:nicotinamidase-related amidase
VGRTALIVIDMLTTYSFEDAEKVAPAVEKTLPQIAGLIERAIGGHVLTVCANDSYGDWHSNLQTPPRDAVASIHPHLAEASLELMERNMRAEIVDAADVGFGR